MRRKNKIRLGVMIVVIFLCIMPIFHNSSKDTFFNKNRLHISTDPKLALFSESQSITEWSFYNNTKSSLLSATNQEILSTWDYDIVWGDYVFPVDYYKEGLNIDLEEGNLIYLEFNKSVWFYWIHDITLDMHSSSGLEESYFLVAGYENVSNRIMYIEIDHNFTLTKIQFQGMEPSSFQVNIDIYDLEEPLLVEYLNPYGYHEIDYFNTTDEQLVTIKDNILIKDIQEFYIQNTTCLFFTRGQFQETYLRYYDSEGNFLSFEDYKTYATYYYNNIFYENIRVYDNCLISDLDTKVELDIYDSFNVIIQEWNFTRTDYVDIPLDVYSLKIKNEYHNPVLYKLKNINTEIIKSGYIFSEEIIEFSLASETYQFNYTKGVEESSININFTEHQILVINSSKTCFLTYVNQKGEYLFFNNYKTYINGTLLYENIFYREIGDIIGIEVKDLYGISIKNQTYTVISGDNYIPVILTLYSLKVINMQEQFNHINITRDPNYYESSYYWSEWIAPNEIIKFNLFAGYYKINLTDSEGGTYSNYAYTLNGDDILLISSDNVISQVIYNIANVNTTLGNQITNVEINITNQNSEINQSIINVEIHLENVNSTLGDLLVAQSLTLTTIENDIGNMFIYMENNFTSLENNMNLSFIDLTNNIFLINDSIYTAIIGIEANLEIVNTTILGNLSLAIQQNEFLTTLFQLTMFSELLNWSGANYNSTFIESQIDTWEFINNYKNQSVQVYLKYKEHIETLAISAQNSIDQFLPKEGVKYRLKSMTTGDYLDDWKPLPENKTIDFGFYSEVVPKIPPPIHLDYTTLAITICFVVACFAIPVIIQVSKSKKKKGRFSY